jgi:hypothetical protein
MVDALGNSVSKEKSEWHNELADKYGVAAERPWLLVELEPPMPE